MPTVFDLDDQILYGNWSRRGVVLQGQSRTPLHTEYRAVTTVPAVRTFAAEKKKL